MTQNLADTCDPRALEMIESVIGQLNVDRLMLESNIASENTKAFYHGLVTGDPRETYSKVRNDLGSKFIGEMIQKYLMALIEFKQWPVSLSVAVSNGNRLYVWAVIEDENDDLERALILAEAKANSEYYHFGFTMKSTIVEVSDELPIPAQYQTLDIDEFKKSLNGEL